MGRSAGVRIDVHRIVPGPFVADAVAVAVLRLKCPCPGCVLGLPCRADPMGEIAEQRSTDEEERVAEPSDSFDGGDLDVDAAVESLAESGGSLVDADMLRVIDWERPDTAVCLVIDRSGSMKGAALASAALAAAAVALRAPAFHAVIAFSGTAEVVRSMVTSAHASADGVVDAVLSLKGHGTTNVSDGLRAAITEHEAARCGRHLTVLLSDCRDRAIDEAVPFAQSLEELVIVSPADDIADAQRFAEVTGAALVGVEGPHDVARALDEVLSRK